MEQCLDHVGRRRAIVGIEDSNQLLQVSGCEYRSLGDTESLGRLDTSWHCCRKIENTAITGTRGYSLPRLCNQR